MIIFAGENLTSEISENSSIVENRMENSNELACLRK